MSRFTKDSLLEHEDDDRVTISFHDEHDAADEAPPHGGQNPFSSHPVSTSFPMNPPPSHSPPPSSYPSSSSHQSEVYSSRSQLQHRDEDPSYHVREGEDDSIRVFDRQKELDQQLSRCLVLLSGICLIGIILVVAASVAKPFEYQQDDVIPLPTVEPFVPVPYDPPVLSDISPRYKMDFTSRYYHHNPPSLLPGQAEIIAYDSVTKHAFIANSHDNEIEEVDFSDSSLPLFVRIYNLSTVFPGYVTSVSLHLNTLVASVSAPLHTDPGVVVFIDTTKGKVVHTIPVASLPDSVSFSNNGKYVVVACEGMPSLPSVPDDYYVDPEGFIYVIQIKNPLQQSEVFPTNFRDFNVGGTRSVPPGVRISGHDRQGKLVTVAQDIEPESVTVDDLSEFAYVTLQENNGVAVVNLPQKRIERIFAATITDRSKVPFDASDRDDLVNIRTYPNVYSYGMPDGIAYMNGYIFLANEGDDRATDSIRVKDIPTNMVSPTAFPNFATLRQDDHLGRLKVSKYDGLENGVYTKFYSFGARSFSIFTTNGEFVYDSGDHIEQMTAFANVEYFNSDGSLKGGFDQRSPASGPEAEGVAVGKIGSRSYVFVTLERFGGVVMYDVTDPTQVLWKDFANPRSFTPTNTSDVGDLSPEGVTFVPMASSPVTGEPVLFVANSLTGTTTLFRIHN